MGNTGELEQTLLQSFLRAAKVRRWLTRPDCPPVIKECKSLFDKAYAPRRDEYSISDVPVSRGETTGTKAVPVPDDLQALVKQPRVVLHSWLPFDRVVYSRSSTHDGNSLICFYPGGNTGLRPVPGSIQHIFELDSKISFGVQRHLPLQNHTFDPYRHYPHFAASLYSAALAPDLEQVEVDWVLCHFAQWLFSPDHVVVVMLSQVRYYSF
jgi:hypothetical protein